LKVVEKRDFGNFFTKRKGFSTSETGIFDGPDDNAVAFGPRDFAANEILTL